MNTFDVVPFPRERELMIDAGRLGAGRNICYGLAEVDVTDARQRLRAPDRPKRSFTAFIIASLARAIAAHPEVQAYRDWRGRLVVFHDVDVVVVVEPQPGAAPVPHVLRQADQKCVSAISEEIRLAHGAAGSPSSPLLVRLAPYLPRAARLLYFNLLKQNPHWFKQVMGTTVVSPIGMFASGGVWGLGRMPNHNLGLTVGGIACKPGVHNGQIAIREYLDLTIAFDHDVIDGAPMARFSRTLIELLEQATLLAEDEAM